MRPEPKKRRYDLRPMGMGLELAAAVVGLTLLGLWIDRRWGTAPWGVVVCASIGFVGGMLNFIRAARRAAADAERRARDER